MSLIRTFGRFYFILSSFCYRFNRIFRVKYGFIYKFLLIRHVVFFTFSGGKTTDNYPGSLL